MSIKWVAFYDVLYALFHIDSCTNFIACIWYLHTIHK